MPEIQLSEFYIELADVFEVEKEEIQDNYQIDWDSLSLISTIAIIDDIFNVVINGDQLNECSSIEKLWKLIQQNI